MAWYGLAAKGFKAGGFNEAENSGDISNFEFDNEESTTFEFGVKSSLANGAPRLDVAVFHTQFDDLQISAAGLKSGSVRYFLAVIHRQ